MVAIGKCYGLTTAQGRNFVGNTNDWKTKRASKWGVHNTVKMNVSTLQVSKMGEVWKLLCSCSNLHWCSRKGDRSAL